MTLRKATPILGSLAMLGLLLSVGLQADERNKKTTVTFSAPVAIPPVHLQGWGVLPAGTYVFKLMDSATDRHIVQIYNKDETQIYATILAIPNYRLQTKDRTVMTFNEGVRGKPESIKAWFYPGANWGEQFVYPKEQAVELAKVTKEPVLAVAADIPAEVVKFDEPAVVAQLTRTPVIAVRPTGEVVELAQVVQTAPPPAKQVQQAQVNAAPAQAPAAPQSIAQNELPDTASSQPLMALFGLLALAGAVTVRSLAKSAR